MASPQAENGHTDINHETMKMLYSFPFSLHELKIVLFVLRKTWGWKRKDDIISTTQLASATGIPRRHIPRALKRLIAKKVLIITKEQRGNVTVNRLLFNKNHDGWVSPKQPLAEKGTGDVQGVPKSAIGVSPKQPLLSTTKVSPKQPPTKERERNYTKETLLRNGESRGDGDGRNAQLTELLAYADSIGFVLQGTKQANRFSAYNLLRRFDFDLVKCKRLVEAATASRGQPYAPTVNDFTQLYRRAGDVAVFYQRKKKKEVKSA